jgi:hypothetical protein
VYGINVAHPSDGGWNAYTYAMPNNSQSAGFLPGISFTGNIAVGRGDWTGPIDNFGGAYGIYSGGAFQSSVSNDASGYIGRYFGFGWGPPGVGMARTNYDYWHGPPAPGTCQ